MRPHCCQGVSLVDRKATLRSCVVADAGCLNAAWVFPHVNGGLRGNRAV